MHCQDHSNDLESYNDLAFRHSKAKLVHKRPNIHVVAKTMDYLTMMIDDDDDDDDDEQEIEE